MQERSKYPQLLIIKQNQIKMINARGYIVPEEEEEILNFTSEEFKQYVEEKLDKKIKINNILSKIYYNPEGLKILVYYARPTPLGKKELPVEEARDFVKTIQDKNCEAAVMIVDTGLNSSGYESLEILDKNIQWTIFKHSELLYNPVEYVGTSQHILLSEEEKKEVLKELKVNIKSLPQIRLNDPIVKYYGWRIGDLIRILREDCNIGLVNPYNCSYRAVGPAL